ncbi:hypothetical protein POPTR_014G065700v4 [Populus trichocarpa]|uniref:Uncharacterized protein n=1 Tax=Populus trichocarpa TaxID=3694 RepID=U7DXF9_POPTR|nr:uncharacterized protein LOC18109682 [Populus trichocarpa]PNT03339.1 hypothetical protein POPTR_014G065700v4 [Populus trichocarpa]|eukprot:XP_006387970.1 uncharacterized protein LOC18109682 isoform X1 [Populus trichocarpa]
MAANHRPDLGFERDSIVVHHGVFAMLVDTLNKQIQVKYQSMPISPYDTHKRVMSAFLAALFIYATASVAEAIPRSQESVYQRLFGKIRLFASALATVFLLVLLTPPWGYSIISILWICLLVSLAYESCQQFYQLLSQAYTDMLEKLFDGERSREEDPS